tara:strand:+ start:1695 stop:1856 length:162 start_codon:yes stop_codon:yes gene_type:complete
MEEEHKIEWAGDYADDDGIRYDTWYCNTCDTDIDDKVQEMEMHECKNSYTEET